MGLRLYVGNLIFAATEKEVREAFEEFGEIRSVHMVKDRATGELRGIAFVEFVDREHGLLALEKMHGANLGGRKLVVNEARPKEPRARAARGDR